jgi:pectate lyase
MSKSSALFLLFLFFTMNHNTYSQLLAFPEAEGAGKFTVGGRNGRVIEVLNLNDNGPGSFRDAVLSKGARTIVFRVSGTILLNSVLKITNDSITIAGQTAPGDGICVKGFDIFISAKQVIIRYLRIRLGEICPAEDDAFGGTNGDHIIIDHCSVSWSIDECMSFYNNTNFTAQWCLISESLFHDHHSKGEHGYGGIWGGINVSFHHNLFAHHTSRTPRFSGSGTTVACFNVDCRNNVIYNWGFNSAYGGEGSTVNMVNNYYKPGPATLSGVKKRIIEPSDTAGRWFVEGNYVVGDSIISANNWNGGVQGSFVTAKTQALVPFPFTPIIMQTPLDAYNTVLKSVGAVLPKRDSVDQRIINDVTTGTAKLSGTWYAVSKNLDPTKKYGIIDSVMKDVGGWPVLNSVPPPLDSDHDAIPDQWELNHGLNPNDSTDAKNIAPSGYSYFEEYLNQLGAFITNVKEDKNYSNSLSFNLIRNYPNPFNPLTKIVFEIKTPSNITLQVFNAIGKKIADLVSGHYKPGKYEITWDAGNNSSGSLASGVYFARLQSETNGKTIKLLFIK